MIFGHHADADQAHAGGAAGEHDGKPAKGKGDKHEQMVVILISFVGVLIAWFTYKSIKGGGAGTTTTTSTTYPVGTGTVAGDTDPNAPAGFDAYLSNLSSEISQLQATVTPTATTTTPTSSAPAFDSTNLDTVVNQANGGSIWQVESNGLYHLTPEDYASLLAANPGQNPTNTPYNDPTQVAPRAIGGVNATPTTAAPSGQAVLT